MKKTHAWKTAPISPTCEKITARGLAGHDEMICRCGDATSFAYPTMNGGWCALCYRHGLKHLPHIETIEALISRGETFG